VLEEDAVALFVPTAHAHISTPDDLRRLIARSAGIRDAVEARAIELAQERLAVLAGDRALAVRRIQEREAAIEGRIRRDRGLLARPIQAGLFDARAARQIEERARRQFQLESAVADGRMHALAEVEQTREPELALLLAIR
jgi:hypothetical protein